MLQGGNAITSTFMQPQYRTTVPGKARIAEENDQARIFKKKQSGDFKKE